MKLASVHFEVMIPIPGGDTVERHFYTHEGWDIDRDDEGAVWLAHSDGLQFIADGFSYTYQRELQSPITKRPRKPKEPTNGGT